MGFFDSEHWKTSTFGGRKYRYLSLKPQGNKPVFLLLHGFPNGPSNWQYFVPLLTDQGFGAIVPELLGYGETETPTDLAAYAFNPMSAQLKELLDAEKVERVILIGHDFGAPLAARFTQFYPERSVGLVLGGSPYAPPSPTALDVDAVLRILVPVLGYENIGYFKFFTADHGPALIEEKLDSFISIMFGPPHEWKQRVCRVGGLEENLRKDHVSTVEPWFSEKDIDELKAYLQKTGLTGPCSWFRAAISPVNVDDHGTLDPRVKLPYLYISPSFDPSYPAPLAARQETLCDDLTTVHIKTGHWIFEQDPEESAKLVFTWAKEKGII